MIFNVYLILAAVIWGLAFVAQRVGMQYMGPFYFNAIRFALGGLTLVPVLYFMKEKEKSLPSDFSWQQRYGAFLLGTLLFLGSTLQQVGLVYTTAGKSGFITGLYVIEVLLLGLFFRQRPSWNLWAGVAASVAGLYLLTVTDDLKINFGDGITFVSTIFWALYIQLSGHLSKRLNPVRLSIKLFFFCSALSFLIAIFRESTTFKAIGDCALPLLYGGVMSVGVAFTLQIVAQKHVRPTAAAIIMGSELVFAAIGGWLILGETLSFRGLVGCALMLIGMILAQVKFRPRANVR
jgi:drug/metabolite transporter (DMT)-like permease